MDIAAALEFAKPLRNGVLITLKRDGRPQSSNITFVVGDDGVVRISITANRAKYVNLRRDPRVSVHISRPDFWAYVVLEGDADLSEPAADPHDAVVDELVELYRATQADTDRLGSRAGVDRAFRDVLRVPYGAFTRLWRDRVNELA